MSGIRFEQTSAIKKGQTGLNIGNQIDGIESSRSSIGILTADALRNLTSYLHGIERQLTDATDNIFPEIAVLGAGGVLIGWIGARDGYVGGWLKTLYVGGNDPTDAPLFADNDGNLILGGKNLGSPYLSVQDNAGVEIGRIGANIDGAFSGAWFQGFRLGGPDILHPTVKSDAAGNVVIGGNATATPYIAIQNSTGAEVGRIGAKIAPSFDGAWFKQVRIGGTLLAPVIQSDAAGNVTINGAALTVSGSGFTVNIDSTNAIKVTYGTKFASVSSSGFFLGDTSRLTAASQLVLDQLNLLYAIPGGNPIGFFASCNAGYGKASLTNALGALTIQMDGSTGAIGCISVGASFYASGGQQVVGNRQVSPGTASVVLADVVSKFNTLLTRLGPTGHGLIT